MRVPHPGPRPRPWFALPQVVLHALAHVPPLRDFFVEPDNYKESKSALVRKGARMGLDVSSLGTPPSCY